eukprot:191963-Ditylum_brightwellii.AAC.1
MAYLERHYKILNDASRDDLILHAMKAFTGCVSGDVELTKENESITAVGKYEKFTLIEGDDLQPYLDWLDPDGGMGGGDDDNDELIAETCIQILFPVLFISMHTYVLMQY